LQDGATGLLGIRQNQIRFPANKRSRNPMRITPECLKGRQDQMRLRKSDSPSSAAHPEYLRLADEQDATQTKARTGIMGETL
jgi:hypothetical protein